MKKNLNNAWKALEAKLFPKFFAAWFIAAAFSVLSMTESLTVYFIHSINPISFIMILVSVFVLLSAANEYKRSSLIPEKTMCAAILVFACILMIKNSNMYAFLPLALFFVLAMFHYRSKDTIKGKALSKKKSIVCICIVAAFFIFIVAAISVCRYKSYSSPNFDFGIFCNMYYNMKHSLQPVSTCERDRLLSHFAVHMSPALYIFLPIYFIFPSPITVALCQVLAIYSGIIPFLLIGKKYGLDNRILVLLSVVFAASPILAGGSMFDFHENCLLVPFLMWTFYFYEKKKTIPMFLFVVLTLLVKEDAFIYICVFSAYIIVAKKDFKKGFPMILLSLGWFLIACTLLKKYGTGVMTNRFDAMMGGDGGLLDIIKTVLFNPGYTSELMLTTTDNTAEKLFYVIKMLFPLALMPFMTKKSARLILILPILLNLLTNYGYQYDIFFQYSFGICTLLLYAALINAADLEFENQKFVSCVSAGLSLMMFCMLIVPKYTTYVGKYQENKADYQLMDEILEEIPEDKSVSATAFILPKLSERHEIYETYYHEACDTDYLIIDIRPGYKTESLELAQEYINSGYVLTRTVDDLLMIYESPDINNGG